jgi:hypothetical protein
MSTQPTWADSEQTDLLELVARGNIATDTAEQEWAVYVDALRLASVHGGGVIDPNSLRVILGDDVKPQRVGAFCNRALSRGLVEFTGEWVTSTDSKGRNRGKPVRAMRWLGGAR